MSYAFDLVAALLGLAALFGYLNHRLLKLPRTIGLLVIAMAASVAVLALDSVLPGSGVAADMRAWLADIDFSEALMKGMLSFLLFAGALHVDLGDLAERKWAISTLATVGVLLSTFLVGGAAWLLFAALGFNVPFIYCLLFGALISPTDPVAVLSILKGLDVPRSLETKIAGESLFNDGVGVVVFTILAAIAFGGEPVGVGDAAVLFLREAVGGALLGLAAGGLAFYALRSIDEYVLEVIITLALVTVGYAVAQALYLSGPIAVVVAGLLIGNQGTALAMSETTREHVHTFWELIDEVLNAILFLLIGLEVVALALTPAHLWAMLGMIPAVLAARFASVGLPLAALSLRRDFTRGAVPILTWGGLRGGISVALALSLPDWPDKDLILAVTYGVVVFSIVVQGTTAAAFVRRVLRANA